MHSISALRMEMYSERKKFGMAKKQQFIELKGGLESFGIFEPVMLKVSVKPLITDYGFDVDIPESLYLKVNRVPLRKGERVKPLRGAMLLIGLPMSTYEKNKEEYVLKVVSKSLDKSRALLRKDSTQGFGKFMKID